MKVISNLPPAKYQIIKKENSCNVIFCSNIKPLTKINGQTGDYQSLWEYDQYTIETPYSANLQAQIEAYYDDWLNKAKNEDLKLESEKIRSYRDNLLSEADTLYCNVENWELMDKDTRLAWQDYKQALRGLTQQAGFPYTISWPKKPLLDVDRSKPTEVEVLRAENDILGQTAAQLQLDNMALNSTVDTLGATVAQLQLENIAAKGGTS